MRLDFFRDLKIWLTYLPPYVTMILIVDLDYFDKGMLQIFVFDGLNESYLKSIH